MIHTLDLVGCIKITDNGIGHHGKCHKLYLDGCSNRNGVGYKYLGKCHTLILSRTTDEHVKHLGNCHTLILGYSLYLTDEGVNPLPTLNC